MVKVFKNSENFYSMQNKGLRQGLLQIRMRKFSGVKWRK